MEAGDWLWSALKGTGEDSAGDNLWRVQVWNLSSWRWEVDPTHVMAPKKQNKTKKQKMWFVANLWFTKTPGIHTADYQNGEMWRSGNLKPPAVGITTPQECYLLIRFNWNSAPTGISRNVWASNNRTRWKLTAGNSFLLLHFKQFTETVEAALSNGHKPHRFGRQRERSGAWKSRETNKYTRVDCAWHGWETWCLPFSAHKDCEEKDTELELLPAACGWWAKRFCGEVRLAEWWEVGEK